MIVVVVRGGGGVWGSLGVGKRDLLMCNESSTAGVATIVVTGVDLTIKVPMCN